MNVQCWIAFEHDETGWPTDAFLVVAAESCDAARRRMADAITERRNLESSRELRARLSDIFIESPRELTATDPRAAGAAGPDQPARFVGFTATTGTRTKNHHRSSSPTRRA